MLSKLKNYVGGFLGLLLIGLLIIAFAAWGISDVFTGFRRGSIASVGDRDIPANEFRYRFSRELDALSRRLNEPLTAEQGRSFGIDRQVLNHMIAMATLDEMSKGLGLAVSDDVIARKIVEDPVFANPSGSFDASTFRRLLQNNGLTEKMFVRDRRLYETRTQLLEAIRHSALSPPVLNELMFNHIMEKRIVEYVILQPDSIRDIVEPSEDELRNFYQQAPNIFTQPERRSASILILDVAQIAQSLDITDEELRREYEALNDIFTEAETRDIDQIVLADDKEYAQAQKLLEQGKGFDAIAAALNQSASDTDLGTVSRGDLIAEEFAEVAFALEKGATSQIIAGSLGNVILRVRKINPSHLRPFSEVKEEIQARVALDKAGEEVITFYEKIEDERAAGTTLETIAENFNLELVQLKDIAGNGTNKDGVKSNILSRFTALGATLFETDMGDELPGFETPDGGYYWVRLDAVTPERISAFDDVRDMATEQWKARERRALLEGLATHFVDQSNQGVGLDKLAGELGKDTLKSPPLNRSINNETFSREAIVKLFATPEGQTTWGTVGFGENLIVMRVTEIIEPTQAEMSVLPRLAQREQEKLQTALLGQLLTSLQNSYGVRIDTQALLDNTGATQTPY